MNIDKGLNYGIIGNCKSSALINKDSSIDWCCLPQFDSSAIFCKIIDNHIGGSFKIEADESYIITQQYINNTAIVAIFMPITVRLAHNYHVSPLIKYRYQ